MISLDTARKLLDDPTMPEDELRGIMAALYAVADLSLEAFSSRSKNEKKNMYVGTTN